MQNPAFAAAGLNSVFIPFLVKDLDAFIRRMVKPETREVELNFGGFSVTMPHKQTIIPHLDEIDDVARAIGAVNTVKIGDGGKLTGYNTDAHGFIEPLKKLYGPVNGARVAVYGAGGAARACVYALKKEGAIVTVFARDVQKARALADEFSIEWGTISASVPANSDILVDTTPFGMKGPLENESLFSADALAGVKFVYDLVTKPADTPIIREAKKAGAGTLGGLEMLAAQGARQFEIWTGGDAPAAEMRNSILHKIAQIQK
jgi:shikimate dehydrogenase